MDPCDSEVEVPRALSLDGLCAGAHHELLMRDTVADLPARMNDRVHLVFRQQAEFMVGDCGRFFDARECVDQIRIGRDRDTGDREIGKRA